LTNQYYCTYVALYGLLDQIMLILSTIGYDDDDDDDDDDDSIIQKRRMLSCKRTLSKL